MILNTCRTKLHTNLTEIEAAIYRFYWLILKTWITEESIGDGPIIATSWDLHFGGSDRCDT